MAKYNQLQHFYKYSKFLDETNAKILEGLAKCGPRNISNLAKATTLPITTVRFRLKRMIENELLLVTVNPNLPRLGLVKAFLITHAMLGRHDTLLKILRNTDYWTYIIRCYGKMDGYCAYFAFPAENKKELENYLKEASALEALSRYKFFWITNSYYVSPDFAWYSFKEKKWNFQWHKWINEILDASEELPYIIKETREYQVIVDKADLIMIKELEKDATIELKKLAEILRITPQSVGNRYRKHIIDRRLIVNYNVDTYPFPLEVSDLYNFVILFRDEKATGRFVNASNGKPFIVSYAKAIGKDLLVVNIYILKREFPNLIKSLNCLYSEGLIKDFSYVTLDTTTYKRQTIAYKNFKNGKWEYNFKERVRKLKKIGRRQ